VKELSHGTKNRSHATKNNYPVWPTRVWKRHAQFVVENLGIPQLSTGDILRGAVASSTAIGYEAEAVMKAGKLVDDKLVVSVVSECIQQPDCVGGFDLDGFPRTIKQAVMLDQALLPLKVNLVLALHVRKEVLVERICGRWIYESSGR
jgi:adenylate kinase